MSRLGTMSSMRLVLAIDHDDLRRRRDAKNEIRERGQQQGLKLDR